MAENAQRALITGANRGLGLEFARRCLGRGDRVFAAARDPSKARALIELRSVHPQRLTIVPLDVADPGSIKASHAAVRAETDGLELLINNAGIYSIGGSSDPSERLGDLNVEDALTMMRTNAVGPLIVAQQYLDLLEAGQAAKIVSISSLLGSISANTDGFPYYYSASKAALNMFMRSLAADLHQRGIISVLLDPGWVSTEMGGPGAPMTPQQAVDSMLRVIDGLTPAHSNRFLRWEGTEQAW